uniref:Uncharacterized protein n=1 Tax=Anguilla anguilla TaxID=7936 RepID=A0A0E9WRF8_ANGAN
MFFSFVLFFVQSGEMNAHCSLVTNSVCTNFFCRFSCI